MTSLKDYYISQAGGGKGFHNIKNQRGFGIFSKLAGGVVPLIKSVARSIGSDEVKDLVKETGKSLVSSAMKGVTRKIRKYKPRKRVPNFKSINPTNIKRKRKVKKAINRRRRVKKHSKNRKSNKLKSYL
jgi:hypothetical protein